MTSKNETILIDSQPIPAQNGVTHFTEEEVRAIVEVRQRLSHAARKTLGAMVQELHTTRCLALEKRCITLEKELS